jgi:internalin A
MSHLSESYSIMVTKFRPLFFLFIVACGSALTGAATQAEDLFPDKGLEAAVRKEVFAKRYNTEPLTKDDVKNISQVMGKGKGIKSLAGLEHCIAVQEIDLADNEITDLAPMAALKLVQSLTLSRNKIESIAPLAELERLQYLELSGNSVSDLAPLAKMTNMRSLYLSNNKITKIDVVKGLKKTWTLYLAGNKVEDFSPIGELKWLTTLDLSSCNLEKLDFLKPLTELNFVMLAENKLTDLSTLVEMAKADQQKRFAPFWRLYLYDNPLSDKAKSEQVAELKSLGGRVFLEKPQP